MTGADHAEADADAEIFVLTKKLRDGDDSAWRVFFNDYYGRTRAYVRKVWRGGDEAVDDLVQETLVRAVRHIRPFESEEALWCWLTCLAKSVVADRGRKESRKSGFLERLFRRTSQEDFDGAGIVESVRELLPGLRKRTAGLLSAKYLEGKTVAEMAVELSLSEKAVESRLTRARAEFRRKWEKEKGKK